MCGIVGIWRSDNAPVDTQELAPMLGAIAHRGPDDRGEWQDGHVALGHQRLTILDLSARANQPMISADGQGVLVYNGEVYNHQDLREILEREGAAFRTTSDTEVILQAFRRWGAERTIPLFNGMFALAYFDRNEDALWLARDRLGIKPLLICQTGRELVFASEAKALLACAKVLRRFDRAVLTAWLLGRPPIGQHTFFEGISSLAAGTWWKVTSSGIARKQYFHALEAVDVQRIVSARDVGLTSFVEALRDTLKTSVRRHMVSDVPVAAMCSGGVDSSLITAYAKEFDPTIRTYVADVVGDDSEAPQAQRVAAHLGVPIETVPVDRKCYLHLWPQAVWYSDAPLYRSSDPALLAVAQKCRHHGIKVLLTGEGSDELFGGYSWQSDTFRLWTRLHRPWRKLYQRWIRNAELRRLRHAPFAGMLSRRDPAFRRRLTIAVEPETHLLPQRFLNRLRAVEPPEDRAFLAQCLYELYDSLPSLLHRHDRLGMGASMEMRVPFLENGMMDLAFHLPRRAKLQRESGKWIVKQAASELLPADVVHAPKKGFPMPAHFTRGCQRLLLDGLAKDYMEWSSATLDEILALAADEPVFRLQITGLEIWMRLFFGNEKPEQIGERLQQLAQ
jgi:asparagine synthase (glutamine-hydrolysing)